MRLCGGEGSEFELRVVGYRFPAEQVDPWDSNWLLVAVRVVSGEGTWEVVDPCLTTWEAARLAEWLDAVGRQEGVVVVSRFVEPNLEFTCRSTPGGLIRLSAGVELETRPPWSHEVLGPGRLGVEMDVTPEEMVSAARTLAAELVEFPLRGDDPTI